MPQENSAKSALAEAFSIRDASSKLGCSPRTARRLVAERKIDHLRIGRRVLITRTALDAYIKRNTVPAVDGKAIAREMLG